jgi:very-short-patch-repair endonuclease
MIRIVDLPDGKWFAAKDICKQLGLANTTMAIKPCSKDTLKQILLKSTNGDQNTNVLNTTGLKQLLSKCKSGQVEKLIKTLKGEYDIDLRLDVIYPYFEASYISIIQNAFAHIPSQTQFFIGKYRIDLYFPKEKIAVECDEKNHSNRNPNEEKERENYITEQLNCRFVRFNPNENCFNIGKVINQIIILTNPNPVKKSKILNSESEPEKEPTKTCTECEETKILSAFYEREENKDGHESLCKKCYVKRQLKARKIRENPIVDTACVSESETKTCKKCQEVLPKSLFRKHCTSKDGYVATCNNCYCPPPVADRTEKVCALCKVLKPMIDYNNCRTSVDGKFAYCRPCNILKNKQYRNKTKK